MGLSVVRQAERRAAQRDEGSDFREVRKEGKRMRTLGQLLFSVTLATTIAIAPVTSNAEEEATKLAKETQNPVADLISVPFQNNFNFNTGTTHATQWVLNVQPVIPVPLGDHWNLVTRTIMPIVNQPELFSGGPRTEAFGLGDINPTIFLSPA